MLRRSFLESVPLATLLAARARNVRLGIRTYVYQAHPMAEAARAIREAGFEAVHIGLRFADGRFEMSQPDWEFARRARETFGQANLTIAGIDGYVPLLHTDPETRKRNVRALAALLERAREFGTPVVATETGIFRGQSAPGDLEAAWKQLLAMLRELLKAAEAGDTILAIEPSFSTFIGTVEAVRRMLEEVASPRLKILWDAAHLIQAADLADTGKAMARAVAAFGSHIVLAHANDVRLGAEGKTESCRAGTGRLDYRAFISLLGRLGREVALCIEHARENEVPETVDYIQRFLKEAF